MTERRIMKQDTFHKWVVTGVSVSAMLWAAMAYYVNAEDTKTRQILQGQIDVLQVQQVTANKVHTIVYAIDKKLSAIEAGLHQQQALTIEVRALRDEVNNLKLEIAKR